MLGTLHVIFLGKLQIFCILQSNYRTALHLISFHNVIHVNYIYCDNNSHVVNICHKVLVKVSHDLYVRIRTYVSRVYVTGISLQLFQNLNTRNIELYIINILTLLHITCTAILCDDGLRCNTPHSIQKKILGNLSRISYFIYFIFYIRPTIVIL